MKDNEALKLIKDLQEVFDMATVNFDEFYKKAQEKSSGYYSQSASSGDYSGCAAIGYRAAVNGDIGNLLMASESYCKIFKMAVDLVCRLSYSCRTILVRASVES